MSKDIITASLAMAVDIYSWVIIGRIFMSWIPGSRESEIGQYIMQITEPVLGAARKIVPPTGMIDWAPIVVIMSLSAIQYMLYAL